MPRSAIGRCLRIGRVGQSAVDGLPVDERRRAIDRRAHERVLKPDLLRDFDQTDRLRRRGRVDAQPDQLRGADQQRGVARRLGRGEEQEPLRPVWHRPDTSQEVLLQTSGDWLRRAHPEAARELRRRLSARELEQCQRVAAGLGDDPVYHPLIDSPGDRHAEHTACVFVIQAPQDELGQSDEGLFVSGVAHREYHRDRLGHQSPRDERERPGGSLIEPLGIVDNAHEWLSLRHFSQQA